MLKQIGRIVLGVLVSMLLLSCVSAIDPGKDPDLGSNTSVIILGTLGDVEWREITEGGINIFADFPDYTLKGKADDVYAFPVSAGKTFSIKSISTGSRYVTFKTLHKVKVQQRGIYYYGVVVTRLGKAVLVTEVNPAIIEMAKKKYPKIFEQLKPVNF